MENNMNKIHLILQGKGGVGKSLVSSLIAQYKLSQDKDIVCIDTDPVNSSFAGYKALNVNIINIVEDNKINMRAFDSLIEQIIETDLDVIIDNGASSFIPLSYYIVQNNIVELLHEHGHEVIIHTVITGGQSQDDTLHGFVSLIEQFPDTCQFVIWKNPYWGDIKSDGKSFEEIHAYTANKDRISAIIGLPKLQKETFGIDFENMLRSKKTFDEAIADSSLTIMNRQRLKMTQREIFNSITAASIV